MKLFTGLLYVHKVRNYKTQAIPESWRQKMNALVKGLKINKPVCLLQSELVKVPVSIGYLKTGYPYSLGMISAAAAGPGRNHIASRTGPYPP